MNFNSDKIRTGSILGIIIASALLIRVVNINNHFSFLSWDAGWYYLSAQGFHKIISLFFSKAGSLVSYLISSHDNRLFLDFLSQFRGENLTLEFIKPFYVLTLASLLFLFPAGWHFYIPLFYNLIISLSTIVVAFFISRELRPHIKSDFIIPIFTVFSGINIYFSHNSVSTNTATFLFSVLMFLTFRELRADRWRNRILIGMLLAFLPATHESLVLIPVVYAMCLAAFVYSAKLRLRAAFGIMASFIVVSFFFQIISLIRSWAILRFADRAVPAYFSHFFEHHRLNLSYRMPFPQYSPAYFLNSLKTFLDIIRASEGPLFLFIFIMAALSILIRIFRREKFLDMRLLYIYMAIFIPAAIFIMAGFPGDRTMGFIIFGSSVIAAIFLESVLKKQAAVYSAVILCCLFNAGNLKDVVSIRGPFLDVASAAGARFKKTDPPEKILIFFSFPELEIFLDKAGLKDKAVYFRAALPEVDEDLYRRYFADIKHGILGLSNSGIFKEKNAELVRLLQNKGFTVVHTDTINNTLYNHQLVKLDALPARVTPIRSAMPAFDDYLLYEFSRK